MFLRVSVNPPLNQIDAFKSILMSRVTRSKCTNQKLTARCELLITGWTISSGTLYFVDGKLADVRSEKFLVKVKN